MDMRCNSFLGEVSYEFIQGVLHQTGALLKDALQGKESDSYAFPQVWEQLPL